MAPARRARASADLFWRWDPLLVADSFPFSAGEYDGEASDIFRALRKGSDEVEIARLLAELDDATLGRPVSGRSRDDQQRLEELAALIFSWYDNSRSYWLEFDVGATRHRAQDGGGSWQGPPGRPGPRR